MDGTLLEALGVLRDAFRRAEPTYAGFEVRLPPELFAALDAAGIHRAFVTLHVGAGTFLPVKADDTDAHKMHAEIGHVDEKTAQFLNEARAGGGRIELGRPMPPAEVFSNKRTGGAVIWATGVGGLADLSADLERPVGGAIKGQAAVLRFAARDRPQLFADGLHIVPHGDGTVAIGSTSERDFETARGTDGRLEALIDRARALCPALAAAPVLERWAGLRPRARSRAPMLGQWPGRPGHFIANGGFKIGFGMAPKVAAVLADLVLDGRDTIPQGFRVCDSF